MEFACHLPQITAQNLQFQCEKCPVVWFRDREKYKVISQQAANICQQMFEKNLEDILDRQSNKWRSLEASQEAIQI